MTEKLLPWGIRAAELEPTEGVYAGYVAWKEWIQSQTALDDLFEDVDEIAAANLYGAFVSAIDFTAPRPLTVIVQELEKLSNPPTLTQDAVKRAKEIVAAVEWSGDMRVNMTTAISAGRVLAKRLAELEQAIAVIRELGGGG